MNELKAKVYETAISKVKEKIKMLDEERRAINLGILEDTKSSAGDKFETGRETMTQDLLTVEKQLKQAKFEFDELCRLQSIKGISPTVQEGSLVHLGNDIFLISLSLGQLDVDGQKIFLLSESSPLGQTLIGQKKGSEVNFRGKMMKIEGLF
ncbi:MAG: hypothetical protein P8O16_19500 [Algoriphagus sp.]|uniref:hypothetical protein n=1 Tax=Algoriphagus sp. TaxID=1872435 RepID=UPI002635F30C|nr:hypothetical protein [Algoriphagus sp.]MDG1279466.1 hypothetical protein [Algoriphagus sp.]